MALYGSCGAGEYIRCLRNGEILPIAEHDACTLLGRESTHRRPQCIVLSNIWLDCPDRHGLSVAESCLENQPASPVLPDIHGNPSQVWSYLVLRESVDARDDSDERILGDVLSHVSAPRQKKAETHKMCIVPLEGGAGGIAPVVCLRLPHITHALLDKNTHGGGSVVTMRELSGRLPPRPGERISVTGATSTAYRRRPSVRRRFNDAVFEAVYVRDRRISRAEFSEVLKPLFSRPSSNKG